MANKYLLTIMAFFFIGIVWYYQSSRSSNENFHPQGRSGHGSSGPENKFSHDSRKPAEEGKGALTNTPEEDPVKPMVNQEFFEEQRLLANFSDNYANFLDKSQFIEAANLLTAKALQNQEAFFAVDSFLDSYVSQTPELLQHDEFAIRYLFSTESLALLEKSRAAVQANNPHILDQVSSCHDAHAHMLKNLQESEDNLSAIRTALGHCVEKNTLSQELSYSLLQQYLALHQAYFGFDASIEEFESLQASFDFIPDNWQQFLARNTMTIEQLRQASRNTVALKREKNEIK